MQDHNGEKVCRRQKKILKSMASKMSQMSFEPARYSIDRSMSLDRKVIGHKTRTTSEPIYENELLKNLTMEICYEATNTDPNDV